LVELEELANNLDEHFKRICKAKVGGATGAIGGGILAAVGFGLSFQFYQKVSFSTKYITCFKYKMK
jgi:transketolase